LKPRRDPPTIDDARIRAEGEATMATTKKCEKGKDPKSCSAEQIKKCHGTTKHACAKK